MIIVFYVPTARPKALPCLEELSRKNDIQVIKVRLTVGFIYSLLKYLIARSGNTYIVLSELFGIYGYVAVTIARLLRCDVAIRVKGYVIEELEIDRNTKRPGVKKRINNWCTESVLKSKAYLIPISKSVRLHMQSHSYSSRLMSIVSIYPAVKKYKKGIHLLGERKNVSDRRYIVSVTNFNFYKKCSPILEYAETIIPVLDENNIDWVILGDGKYRDELATEINRKFSEVSIDIRMVGHVVNVQEYLMGSIGHVYFSKLDTVSNALLESFVSNIPCLISDEYPVSEIRESLCADQVMFKRRSEDSRIIFSEFLFNKDKRENFVTAQNLVLNQYFNFDVVCNQLSDVLWTVAGPNR